jgi:Ca-activated chloride channel family protein
MKRAVPAVLRSRNLDTALLTVFLVLIPTQLNANTQLVLSRAQQPPGAEYKGVVDLVVDPGADVTSVALKVDGERVADSLHSPWRVTVDLGPRVIEHKISVTAVAADKRRVQWSETINHGHMPLTIRLNAVDAAKGVFEAQTTAPDDDPIAKVDLWNNGTVVATADTAPFRLSVTAGTVAAGFVQATARTKSGEEAADFWSSAGEVHVDNVDVRTVPLYVSVVDRNGNAREDVDKSLFRIIDGDAEGKILQFRKAFDEPISIALLLDASASMVYSMREATTAAKTFVDRTLHVGDRCAVYAVRSTPRIMQPLTDDKASIAKALQNIKPEGDTALYDAIDIALRDLKDEKNRRAVVVLTDGGDNESMDSWDDVERNAREAGIPIYFVAYESLEPTARQDYDRMTYLSTETGGFVTQANEQTLLAKYGDIERDLRAQFAITYQVTSYAKHNEWRKVRVVLKEPKLVARTIGGYFAP